MAQRKQPTAAVIAKAQALHDQAPLTKALESNPEILNLQQTGGTGKVKLTDSAGTEWTVDVQGGNLHNATMGHPIRNSLIGVASAIPGIAQGFAAPMAAAPVAASAAPTVAGTAGPTSILSSTIGGGSQIAPKVGAVSKLGSLGKFFSGDMGKLLTTGGLGLAEGLLGPKQQVRKGYSGNVDPQKLLSESNDRLNNVFGGALKRSQTAPDFSNVRAQTPQGLTGVDPGMGSGQPGMHPDMAEMLKHLGMLGVKF